MKKQFLKSNQLLASLLTAVLVLLFVGGSQGQTPCPPEPLNKGIRTSNPEFPTCQPPGLKPFRVLLVLDESGSINDPVEHEGEVEAAVLGFANALSTAASGLGKVELGIIEFSDGATSVVALTDVKKVTVPSFGTIISNYLSDAGVGQHYNPNLPGAGTNFEAALAEARTVAAANDVDIIFFITDGHPTRGNLDKNVWGNIADQIKCRAPIPGTYIFGIGIGLPTPPHPDIDNLKELSGPHQLGEPDPFGVPYTFQSGADWTRTNFVQFAEDFAQFATSLIDTRVPIITCPPNIRTSNDLGVCGKTVNYTTSATDDCVNVNVTCTPSPGSFFNVGQTIVNCKATDNAGNTATCSFKVTILDLEAPKITCPPNKLISCEESSAPANTGSPTTSDNCGVGSVSHADVRADGSCPNEFTINRTWTVADINGNANNCLQTISVEDKKKPVITCPANVTVECDTSVAKTGKAIATDNCDMDVSIVWASIHISGDCEWFCVTERHWKATDNCGNTSKCVQVITKDVTPLIEKALKDGPLVWGQTAATVTLPPGRGACVVQWLPYSGVVPTALRFDDAVAGTDCRLMSNPLDGSGHIVNPLLGEAMKLKILVRLNPSLGTRKVKQILDSNIPPCEMHFIVRQALGGGENATVNELLRVTDLTLGNVNVNLLVPEHALHLLAVLKCVNKNRDVCKNP